MTTFPIWAWLVFSTFILLMLALDFFVLHRPAKEISFREAVLFSAFWIALLFGVFVWACSGRPCSAPSPSVTI